MKKTGPASSKQDSGARSRSALGARPKVILDSLTDAVITVGIAGLIRGWSERAERMFGWTAAEVVGSRWVEIVVPPGDREGHEREFLAVLHRTEQSGPVGGRWEFGVIARDGREFPVETTVTSVRMGGLGLYCLFIRDISERRAAERARLMFDDLVRSSADAIITSSVDGIITSWNPGAERIYGHRAEEVIGRPLAGIVPPERQAEEAAARARVLRGEPVEGYETERVRADGTLVPILNTLSPIRNRDGRIQGLSAIGRDISPRKRAEAERDLFFSMSLDLTCLCDLEGGFIRVNPAWERVLGYPPAGLAGRRLLDLIHPDDQEGVRNCLDRLARGHPTAVCEARCIAGDGSVRRFSWVAAPVPGRRIVIASGRDVTEQRSLEDQFRQAQKMEAVGRLAAGVAHDFNNLLTVVLGTADLLLDTLPPDDPSREDIDTIRKVSVRATSLTRQLLAFSRGSAIASQPLNLSAVVTGLTDLLKRLVGADVAVRTHLAPDLGAIRGDVGQIEQVIVNLAVNARDAMPGGGSLLLETAEVEFDLATAQSYLALGPGHYSMLAVTDTGTGMDAETRSRIFEPFFTTKAASKGTGLGLSTVYGIVRQCGGQIYVYSEPGRGTTFKMYFPRDSGEAEPVAPVPGAVKGLDGTETVLVVEDDPAVGLLVQRLLRAHGYRVLLAQDGGEAMKALADHEGEVQLIITDVVLPGTAGPDLVERLLKGRPALRVLFISGYTDDTLARHASLRPGLNYLPKPFSRQQLAERVRSILDHT